MNAIRRALGAGRASLGMWCSVPTPISAELLAREGFEWLAFDLQHGELGPADVLGLVQAAELGGAAVVLRVPWNEPAAIMRAVDLGVSAVIVPMVQTAGEAAAATAAIRYPPLGIRSYGPTRSGRALETANDDVICLVMIETAEALKNVEEIAAVPGVDGLFVGPVDLAISLGHGVPEAGRHAAVDQALDACVTAAARHGGFVGSIAFDPAHARKLLDRGVRFASVGNDKAYLRTAAARDVAAIRALIEDQ